jgi:hypothetical protein
MKTITSISGGKTSSMMAVEFPTDHYVFSVVLTDQGVLDVYVEDDRSACHCTD